MLTKLLNWLGGRSSGENAGAWAENIAAEWLRRERHFQIIARNWRNPRDLRQELDLVCHDGEVLVFVEVKARSEHALVSGYHAVDRRKKRALVRATKSYLSRLRPKPRTFRLDIVEVALPAADRDSASEPVVRHFQNIPLFSKDYY